jgi:hypothetical protein
VGVGGGREACKFKGQCHELSKTEEKIRVILSLYEKHQGKIRAAACLSVDCMEDEKYI